MNIGKLYPNLYDNTYDYLEFNSKATPKYFKESFTRYINILSNLINIDFNKISDKELYNLLSEVYLIGLNKNDYIKMVNNYYNGNYRFDNTIETNMVCYSTLKEERLYSKSNQIELFRVYYEAAVKENFKLPNSSLTKDEIKMMLNDKKIALLKEIRKEISTPFTMEEYETLPVLGIKINTYKFFDNIDTDFVNNHFSLFGDLLRKEFTKTRINKDCKIFAKTINDDLRLILRNPSYRELTEMCNEWYNSSLEKEQFEEIQKKLELKKH